MFGFIRKNPLKKLEQRREKLLEEAMRIQRSGDLRLYAARMTDIDELEKEIDRLRKDTGN